MPSLIALSLVGCAHVAKNRNDAYVPAQLQCPTEQDPSCVGSATAGIAIPIREKRTPSTPLADQHAFVGRCELFVDGESAPRSCNAIKLVARSTRNNETRAVDIDGFTFRVVGPGDTDAYTLEALNPQYEVITDSRALNPGQNIKIRVKTKPRL